jgi:uncharacterized phage protein (TIGR01671 family)
MREIKFRAWDKVLKYMLPQYDNWIDFEGNYWTSPDQKHDTPNQEVVRGDHYILMQFTGLHDKNGKEIYEGDVVHFAIKARRCDCDGETELLAGTKFCPSCGKRVALTDFIQVAQVKYHKAGFALFYTRPESNYSWSYHAAEQFIAWIEVIGNIHEHPELLTQPTTV